MKIIAQYDSTGIIVGNLRRRESIPLFQFAQKYYIDYDDLNYRRTKEIRTDGVINNRRYEVKAISEKKIFII